MPKFSLTCFGVGDGWPCADRNHASFLYRFGKTSLLLDCGESLSRGYKAKRLGYDAVDRIIISHLHSDHTAGFFMFMQGLWLEGRTKPLPVHLPKDGIKPFQSMLEAGLIFPELLRFKLRFEALRLRRAIVTGGVRVTPFRSSHLDQLRLAFQKRHRQKFQAFCFLLETPGARVVHSADIGSPEDLDPLLEKPVDLLVCEMAHFQPEDLLRYLRGRPIKHIVFVHVARPYWESLRKTKLIASRLLGHSNFTFAHDGEEIAF